MTLPNKYELTGNVEFLLWEACGQGAELSKTPVSNFEILIRGIIDKNTSIIRKDQCISRIEKCMYAILTSETMPLDPPRSRIEMLLYDIYNKHVPDTGVDYYLLTDEHNNFVTTEDNDTILIGVNAGGSYEVISRIEKMLDYILKNKIWH